MTVAVLVPWRSGGCPHREAAWVHVAAMWDSYGWPVITADDGGQPFSRGCSINYARATVDADVYLIVDADIIVPHDQAVAAAAAAHDQPGLVVAFDEYRYLTPAATVEVLAGADPAEVEHAFTYGWGVSCCVAVSAKTFDTVAGFDPRFRAWGAEDVAFEAACSTLAGPLRKIAGPVWHLWHPSEPERPAANFELGNRYGAARGNPAAMAALIDEARR